MQRKFENWLTYVRQTSMTTNSFNVAPHSVESCKMGEKMQVFRLK